MDRRLFIASDFLMTSEVEQQSSLRWMMDALSRPLARATGCDVEQLLGCDHSRGLGFSRRKFFELSGVSVDPECIQFWFDRLRVSLDSINYLREFVGAGDILIGYELSDQTRSVLDEIGVLYVDMWLHPIRFMDDVLFAMKSSSEVIHDKLKRYSVSLDEMQLYADRIKVQTYKGWHRKEAEVVDGSAVFIGQLQNDKSVCRDGKFLTLLDFKREFSDFVSQHSHVYFSRHPYMRSGDTDVLRFVQSHSNVSITDQPTYRLIASPKVKTVGGISSSVLSEAEFFGKQIEYFYQPVLNFRDQDFNIGHASIQQDFLNPRFWAEVFDGVFANGPDLDEVPNLSFTDRKDKVRDMLGYYWSYWQIDKVENFRAPRKSTTSLVELGVSAVSDRLASDSRIEVTAQTHAEMNAAKRIIDLSEVVSFDIFDTLIERNLRTPSDLFKIIAPQAEQIVEQVGGEGGFDFERSRRASREWALPYANGEEVLLSDRYRAIGEKEGLSDSVVQKLYELEIAAELDFCRLRWAGNDLLQYALERGKRVILVSDIYFDRRTVESILRASGIAGYDKLYLSSEEGVLKATGRLFDTVLAVEGVAADRVVHIGDNLKSDIQNGSSRGLRVIHLPEVSRLNTGVGEVALAYEGVRDERLRSVVSGLAVNRLGQAERLQGRNLSGGSVGDLGYSLLGPMMVGFASWVLKSALQRGVEDIYFLARDGKVVKQCYDLIAPKGSPRSHYILASRRSVNVAGLTCEADILALMKSNMSPCSLRLLMKNRFGLDDLDRFEGLATKSGFSGLDEKVSWDRCRVDLESFLTSPLVVRAILENAAAEAAELRSHYAEAGLSPHSDGSKIAFVDIGHTGSIQRGIGRHLGLTGTNGFYFSTTDEIDHTLSMGRHAAFSYFGDRVHSGDKAHPYRRNILMFEAAFLPQEDSFVRIRGGEIETVGDPLSSINRDRKEFSRVLHGGIVELARDLGPLASKYCLQLDVAGEEIVSPFLEFLQNPGVEDARLFQGISFEASYSGRDHRWLVPPSIGGGEPGLWEEGVQALMERRKFGPASKTFKLGRTGLEHLEPEGFVHRLVCAGVELFLPIRKRQKFRRNPYRFFRDSKKTTARVIGEGIYWKHYDQ